MMVVGIGEEVANDQNIHEADVLALRQVDYDGRSSTSSPREGVFGEMAASASWPQARARHAAAVTLADGSVDGRDSSGLRPTNAQLLCPPVGIRHGVGLLDGRVLRVLPPVQGNAASAGRPTCIDHAAAVVRADVGDELDGAALPSLQGTETDAILRSQIARLLSLVLSQWRRGQQEAVRERL